MATHAQPLHSERSARAYRVEPDTSRLRGYPERVWHLRCYGMGQGYLCEGQRIGTYPDETTAHRKGRAFVATGIIPAHQGFDHGLPATENAGALRAESERAS